MNLSLTLQAKVKIIAHHYGHGFDGDDMAQDCFVLLWELPEDTSTPYALRCCHNVCLSRLRSEEIRATKSLTFEPILYGETVDVEKYIAHIKNIRLRAIVDRFVDKETSSNADRRYFQRYRFELDRDLRKYLKQKSAWMIWFDKVEPFRRSFKKLSDYSTHLAMLRTQ